MHSQLITTNLPAVLNPSFASDYLQAAVRPCIFRKCLYLVGSAGVDKLTSWTWESAPYGDGQYRSMAPPRTRKVLPARMGIDYEVFSGEGSAESSPRSGEVVRLGSRSGMPHQTSQARMELVGCFGSYFTLVVWPGRNGAAAAISGSALRSCAAS